jgi:uncharacterized protein
MPSRIQHQYEGTILTPALWKGDAVAGLEQIELDFTNTPPFEEEINPNQVLGKRAEAFIEAAIKQSPDHELIASNIQIIDNKTTVGELDYLIYDKKNKEHLHIELIYKFYLYNSSVSKIEINKWIGPNRNDSFDQKLDKLINKQLPLLQHPKTIEYLASINLDVNLIKQQVLFLGNLYIPYCTKRQYPVINNNCIKGYWLTQEQFDESSFGDHLYYLPQKQDWPVDPSSNNIWLGYNQIKLQIKEELNNKRSPLIWMKTEDDCEPFFVVWWD